MKTAVITGGNKGLGLAQTKRFVKDGYQVHVVARSKGDLGSVDGDVTFVEADLSRNVGFLSDIHAKTGNIDVLVNNAGMHLKKPMWDVSPEEFDQVIGLNVKAMFLACGRYVELQKPTGGAIVNISSMGGLLALPNSAAYVTAKTAVVGLTRSVCVDAAPFGIRCNAVAPGFIDTDMTRAILAKDPARRDKIEGRIPGGKFGQPEDIAEAVHFLASDRAAHISGVLLPVDGGYSVGF
ncbi:SDR family NAD(P)-dependent oxidoreductase [Pacificoceanicola onchidii]|uniref:SDR family NAD(P)-dependent oxidoreductase n=1 Tax=Pacificoceanicola onchidii TaxID=2562685 RepID=UPI0010A601BF|nr:SDR family NAD(P)-dependent oxidoreductase [Pacificoceanicola onchidii]